MKRTVLVLLVAALAAIAAYAQFPSYNQMTTGGSSPSAPTLGSYVKLTPLNAAPVDCADVSNYGTLFYYNTTATLCFCAEGAWVVVTSGGSCPPGA